MTGDQADIFARLKGYLPTRWFGSASDSTPILDAVLTGIATCLSFIYSLYAYTKLQTRIATATDGWLDMISGDFFGLALPRKTGESDNSFRSRIQANLLRPKATRGAVTQALVALTGRTPVIVEPARPADTGAYGGPSIGYGAAGAYGSMLLPYQCFITAYRPHSSVGIASVAGYGISTGGYGQASRAEYADITAFNAGVTDTDIFAVIDAVKPAATIAWTRIEN
jgi:hypothetical protein